MKTPPLLLFATLAFWGWQSGLLWAGVAMGAVLESSWLIKARWDLTESDFRRILTACTVLSFMMAVYAFSSNEDAGSFSGLFYGDNAARTAAANASVVTSMSFFRWLPMPLFFFVLAQVFSSMEKIPLTAISVWSRRKALHQKRSGLPVTSGAINVTYPYFILCLFSAGIHSNPGNHSYFWGEVVLLFWALWPFRLRHAGKLAWIVGILAVVFVGFVSQRGIAMLDRLLEGYNAQWIARLLAQRNDPMKAQTSMGRIGALKLSNTIVIRLHTDGHQPPPEYLREASYRVYRPREESWFVGRGRSDFQFLSSETNQTSWILVPGKTNRLSVNIACYLRGGTDLLPLPSGSGRLENLNAFVLQKNSQGAVLVEGPRLVIFDALYGPGEAMDAPPYTGRTNMDLAVPEDEKPALDQVIAQAGLSGNDEQQTLRDVNAFFENNFTYSLWQGRDKLATTNETTLSRFLTKSRSGHCEYFASATVLLLRELKIPARYAVGYLVHEKTGHGYVVRQRDAHAWCLVWNPATGTWEDFDTTPASWVKEEAKRGSSLQWISDFRSWLYFEFSKLWWRQTNFRIYLLWALVPVLIVLLWQILFRSGKRQRKAVVPKKSGPGVSWPGLDSEFYRLEQHLAARGVPRQPGEPLTRWLERITGDPDLASLKQPLQELLRLHYRHRFDPHGLDVTDREKLRKAVKECLDAARSGNYQIR